MSLGLAQFCSARALVAHDLSLATSAVWLAPSDPETYRVRAVVLARQNKLKEATADLTRAATLNPSDWQAWAELGDAQKLKVPALSSSSFPPRLLHANSRENNGSKICD